MKKFLLLKCVIVLVATFVVSAANAMPINVISEEHHVDGFIFKVDFPYLGDAGESIVSSYDTSSPYPVNNSISVAGYDFQAYARSEAGNFNVYSGTGDVSWGDQGVYPKASVRSIYMFTSPKRKLSLKYFGEVTGDQHPVDGWATIVLYDATESLTILNKETIFDLYDSAGYGFGTNMVEGTYSFIPGDHTYLLTLQSWSRASNGLSTSQMTANFTPAPEPATILLFGTGIVGLVGSQLRRKKK